MSLSTKFCKLVKLYHSNRRGQIFFEMQCSLFSVFGGLCIEVLDKINFSSHDVISSYHLVDKLTYCSVSNGIVLFSTGIVSFSNGFVSFSTGFVSFSTGIVSFSTGIVSFSNGFVSFSTGIVSFSTGIVSVLELYHLVLNCVT